MSDDILEQATRALRRETEGTDDSARFTRSRILRSVHQTERRRRSYIAFVLPIAAVLVGSTAFAASGGNWKAVARAIGFAEPAPAPAPALPPPAPKAVVAVPAPQPEPEATPEPKNEAVPPSTENAVKTTQTGKTTKPAPAPVDLSDPEIALYKKAHQLHFEGGSPAAALAAWDSYLAKSPRGRFSAEASYNRAITLARLGRTTEAKAALQPFANGSYGSYRKESATKLIEGLDGH
jgi:outer membrane biosynthesis protein TonB